MKIVFEFYERDNLIFNVEKNVCVVGKSDDCDVKLDLDGFSRKHCQIEVIDDVVFVTDLNSTNGVEINEEKIIAGEKTVYHPFLPLRIGPTKSVEIIP
jgi:pSer/pThr/pTyr-binding forkhead associated (FHA) protein